MEETRKEALECRWQELHRQLQDLLDGKLTVADPGLVEDEIQEELEAIEEELRANGRNGRSGM